MLSLSCLPNLDNVGNFPVELSDISNTKYTYLNTQIQFFMIAIFNDFNSTPLCKFCTIFSFFMRLPKL